MKAKIYAKPDAKHDAQSKSLTSGHVGHECCIEGIIHILLGCVELNFIILTQLNFRIVKARGWGYADIIVELIDQSNALLSAIRQSHQRSPIMKSSHLLTTLPVC
jgi:hypothetical protein